MSHFRKKPVVVEAITFEELVQHGIDSGGNVVNGMPWSFSYKGHPISHENDECYLIPTLEGTHNMTPADVLITGIAGEIYPCKKTIFEATYEAANPKTMNFGQALEALKAGQKVCRRGWNGKGMWLSLSCPDTREIPAENFWSPHNAEFARQNGGSAKVLPCITMKTVDSTGREAILMGWLASQTDMLSEDWEVLP